MRELWDWLNALDLNSLQTSDRLNYLAAVSQATATLLSLVALLLSIWVFGRQVRLGRWQLRVQREAEVLTWARACILQLASLENALAETDNQLDAEARRKAMVTLSALTDEGRMFFPNQLFFWHHHSVTEKAKEHGYRGVRQRILDPLVLTYDALETGTHLTSENMRRSRRYFVSQCQRKIDPRAFNRIRGR